MNNVASPLAAPLAPETGWQTLSAPEIFKFEKVGDTVAGKLISLNIVRVKEKSVPEYMLELGPKKMKLLGTYDLVQKLTRAHIGCAVRIKYLGENKEVSRNGNAMRVFDVQIKGAPAVSAENVAPISDEDIPF